MVSIFVVEIFEQRVINAYRNSMEQNTDQRYQQAGGAGYAGAKKVSADKELFKVCQAVLINKD